jgi:predicted RNA binding protein YcfA (HicA-like mRNA interferase family)
MEHRSYPVAVQVTDKGVHVIYVTNQGHVLVSVPLLNQREICEVITRAMFRDERREREMLDEE